MTVIAALMLSACASSAGATASVGTGSCPVAPLRVVVSVNQWGDITSDLGGSCAEVDTIIADAKIDPHDYEPTPGDIAKFAEASLVVVNGVGYDAWAVKAIAAVSPPPTVVDAGQVNSVSLGQNPHLWYRPSAVTATADAVTAALSRLAPTGATIFRQQNAAWKHSIQPYLDEIARVRAGDNGRTFGATESVFDYMAAAVGLADMTPPGYRLAIANGSEPSPGDLELFESWLRTKKMSVLVYNIQTAGAVPDELRAVAAAAGVPVVAVTESVPNGETFKSWQISQLQALAAALGTS